MCGNSISFDRVRDRIFRCDIEAEIEDVPTDLYHSISGASPRCDSISSLAEKGVTSRLSLKSSSCCFLSRITVCASSVDVLLEFSSSNCRLNGLLPSALLGLDESAAGDNSGPLLGRK